jgi:FAD:protein FMN transferase
LPLNRPIIVLLLIVLAAWLLLGRGGGSEQDVRQSRILLGTLVEIQVPRADEGAREAVAAAFAEMARIEALMSPHVPGSDVARLSGGPGPLEVAPETAEVLALGLEIARGSDGAFDLTLGRLKDLWDLEGEQPQVPAAEAVAEALRGIGPEALRLEGRLVHKREPQLAVDLGGIAKGYAVDRAVELLRRAGVTNASVNAGGDLRLLGSRGERPWRIGIRHPRSADELLTTLEVSDRAVVTSGDYERYFEADGRRYHHLFDPRTGFPAGAARSVTLVADSAMLADGLGTAVFVLGPERGLALLARYPQVEALIVDAEGALHQTPGMAELQR